MVGHNLVVIGKRLVTDCTFPVLLNDFSIQHLPLLTWRPQFSVSSGVLRIFDALNTTLKSAFFSRLLATAAEQGAVDWAVFIPTEFHGYAPV